MIEYLESSPDVVAVKLSGKLVGPELEALVLGMEKLLEQRERTHVYVETDNFSGFDIYTLPDYFSRVAEMLGKLKRFGRIAVVTDQRWIRWLTRIESALLPNVRYETFTLEEKAAALAWVEGRRKLPHDPALKIIETDRPGVLGFELDGTLTAPEVEAAADYFDGAFDQEGPVRLLGRIRQIGGAEPSAMFSSKYLQMKLKALRKVDRYALVGGPSWLSSWAAALNPLVWTEIRHFDADEEALAWAWLGAEPKSERALAA